MFNRKMLHVKKPKNFYNPLYIGKVWVLYTIKNNKGKVEIGSYDRSGDYKYNRGQSVPYMVVSEIICVQFKSPIIIVE